MNSPAVITGVGLMTVLGHSAAQTWDALLAGQSVCDHARIAGIEATERARFIGQSVATEALQQANWNEAIRRDESTALIVATSKGPIEYWLNAAQGQSNEIAAGALSVEGLSQITHQIADSSGLGPGPRLTYSTACSSGLHALVRAAMMISAGEACRVLVVAAEASVHPLFINSFRRLGVLPPEGFGCRPFDKNRQGFIMTEAGAAICLERAESNLSPPLAAIDRFAIGGDAVHLTAGDPDGTCLSRLLRRVVGGRRIDLVHAHGTGTISNDPIEINALESILPESDSNAFLYSHKGALGHSLGAAGLVSIVLNCMAHSNDASPPNIRTHVPLPTKKICIAQTVQRSPIRRSIAIAAGFGGPLAVVSLLKAG